MRISGTQGAWLQLDVTGWEFPHPADGSDSRWLMLTVSASLGGRSGRRWSFTDPCMDVDEARALAAWLRASGHGHLPVEADTTQPSLTFLEPVLGFTLAARDSGKLLVRVFFAVEGVPDWARRRDPATEVVDLWTRPDALLDAADEWDDELRALPARH